jgi:hypothetical protein
MVIKTGNCFQCNAPIFTDSTAGPGEQRVFYSCECARLSECCSDERHYRVEWFDESHFEQLRNQMEMG